MRFTRLLWSFAVAAGLTIASGCSSDSTPATHATSASQPNSIRYTPALAQTEAIDRIRTATTPSQAVAQYSSAVATGGDVVALEKAYVARMIAFGMPEMAEAQAIDLTRRAPDDARAWAVVAFMNARRGLNDLAIQQLDAASRKNPDELFVQRTAGQLLAWYDSRPDHDQFSSDVKNAAFALRERLHERAVFAAAYRDAWDALHPNEQAFAPSTQPTEIKGDASIFLSPPSTSPSTAPTTQPYATGEYDSGLPPAYYPPYYYEPYTYPSYGWPYEPWWAGRYPGPWLGYGYSQRYPYYDYRFYDYRYRNHVNPYRPHFLNRGFDRGGSFRRFDHDRPLNRSEGQIHDYRRLHDDPRAGQRPARQMRRVAPHESRPAPVHPSRSRGDDDNRSGGRSR